MQSCSSRLRNKNMELGMSRMGELVCFNVECFIYTVKYRLNKITFELSPFQQWTFWPFPAVWNFLLRLWTCSIPFHTVCTELPSLPEEVSRRDPSRFYLLREGVIHGGGGSSRKTDPVTLSPLPVRGAAATEGQGSGGLTTVIKRPSLTKLIKHGAIKLNLL